MALLRRKPRLPRRRLDVHLNARVQPMHRGELYEDPLEAALEASYPGSEITGSGSEFDPEVGVLSADLEISLAPLNEEDDGRLAMALVIETLERAGAPRGSYAMLDGADRVDFGQAAGLGVHLNGVDLPDEVYAANDVNDLVNQLAEALGNEGGIQSYWEGPTELSFFIYGPSEDRMRDLVTPVLNEAPLAQRCRFSPL